MIKVDDPHALLARAVIDRALYDYKHPGWSSPKEFGFETTKDEVVAYLEGPEFETHVRLCHMDPRRMRKLLEEEGIL